MKWQSKTLFFLSVTANSILVFYVYLIVSRIGASQLASFADLLTGTAARPYVYRLLVPLLVKIISPFIPPTLPQWNLGALPAFQKVFYQLNGDQYPREVTICLIIMFLSLAGFAYAERGFLNDLGFSARDQFILPLIAQILILPFTVHFAYIYDLPQILLITLSLRMLCRQKWASYLFWLAIATLNKETSLLLIIVFMLYYWTRVTHRAYFAILSTQGIIYILIRAILFELYQNNPGENIVWAFSYHYVQYTTEPITLIFTVILFATIAFLMVRNWYEKHEFLRTATIMPLLILGLFFVGGMPMEFRVFLDALPVMAVMIFPPKLQEKMQAQAIYQG